MPTIVDSERPGYCHYVRNAMLLVISLSPLIAACDYISLFICYSLSSMPWVSQSFSPLDCSLSFSYQCVAVSFSVAAAAVATVAETRRQYVPFL